MDIFKEILTVSLNEFPQNFHRRLCQLIRGFRRVYCLSFKGSQKNVHCHEPQNTVNFENSLG